MIVEFFPNERPCELAPPRAFSDKLAPENLHQRLYPGDDRRLTGRHSATAERILATNCAGCIEIPSAEDLFDGLRRSEPTPRQLLAVETWLLEASSEDEWRAWVERVYSWRLLVEAMHRHKLPLYGKRRHIHLFATNQDLVPKHAFPVI